MSDGCDRARFNCRERAGSSQPTPNRRKPCPAPACRGTGHHEPAVPRPVRDKALRPNNRKPESVKEWFDLWKNPNPPSCACNGGLSARAVYGRAVDVIVRSIVIDPGAEAVGRSLRGIGLVHAPPRRPNFARHFPAGRALVSDETRLNSKRRDPHDLPRRLIAERRNVNDRTPTLASLFVRHGEGPADAGAVRSTKARKPDHLLLVRRTEEALTRRSLRARRRDAAQS